MVKGKAGKAGKAVKGAGGGGASRCLDLWDLIEQGCEDSFPVRVPPLGGHHCVADQHIAAALRHCCAAQPRTRV